MKKYGTIVVLLESVGIGLDTVGINIPLNPPLALMSTLYVMGVVSSIL